MAIMPQNHMPSRWFTPDVAAGKLSSAEMGDLLKRRNTTGFPPHQPAESKTEALHAAVRCALEAELAAYYDRLHAIGLQIGQWVPPSAAVRLADSSVPVTDVILDRIELLPAVLQAKDRKIAELEETVRRLSLPTERVESVKPKHITGAGDLKAGPATEECSTDSDKAMEAMIWGALQHEVASLWTYSVLWTACGAPVIGTRFTRVLNDMVRRGRVLVGTRSDGVPVYVCVPDKPMPESTTVAARAREEIEERERSYKRGIAAGRLEVSREVHAVLDELKVPKDCGILTRIRLTHNHGWNEGRVSGVENAVTAMRSSVNVMLDHAKNTFGGP